jgi:hypothetical protein
VVWRSLSDRSKGAAGCPPTFQSGNCRRLVLPIPVQRVTGLCRQGSMHRVENASIIGITRGCGCSNSKKQTESRQRRTPPVACRSASSTSILWPASSVMRACSASASAAGNAKVRIVLLVHMFAGEEPPAAHRPPHAACRQPPSGLASRQWQQAGHPHSTAPLLEALQTRQAPGSPARALSLPAAAAACSCAAKPASVSSTWVAVSCFCSSSISGSRA